MSDRSRTPLVGRAAELSELRSALTALAGGVGGCVVVEGPAGIGKSRLLTAASDDAADLGLATAVGRSTEFDRVAPLTALLGALRGSTPPVLPAESTAELAGAPGAETSRFWLLDRLGSLIEEYTRRTPLVILLDDVQWADELTALALRFLIPALRTSPTLWLLARRPLSARTPAMSALDWLVEEGAARLALQPLSDEAVADICVRSLGATPDESVLRLAARTGGNPFLLQELLTALQEEGRIARTGTHATVTATDLPAGFLDAVNRRLRHLSDEARSVLDAAAVLGRPFSVHEAAALLGRSALDLVDAIREASRAGALVDSGQELDFRHDLIREAVYDALPAPVRQAMHREAVTVLQAEGRSVVEAACHVIRASRRGDLHAISILRDAVKHTSATAPGTAADLTLRMLDLLEDRDPERPRLVGDALRLLTAAGRLAEARELGERFAAGPDGPAGETTVLLGLAESAAYSGQDDAVLRYSGQALSAPRVPEPIRAQLLALRARALVTTGDLAAAEREADAAVRLARDTEERRAETYALTARAVAASAGGEFAAAVAAASEAVTVADAAGGDARGCHPRLWLGPALVAVDRFAEAAEAYAAGQRESEALGTAWPLPLWHHRWAELHHAAGRLDDARAEAESGVRVADQIDAPVLGAPLLATLARIAVHAGDLPAARAHLRRTHRVVTEYELDAAALTWASALYCAATDDPRGGRRHVESLLARPALLRQHPLAVPELVGAALRADARDLAAVLVRLVSELVRKPGAGASVAGAAAHAEGLFHGDLDRLREAVRLLRGTPRPLAVAAALRDSAALARRHGLSGEAAADVAEAHRLTIPGRASRGAGGAKGGPRRPGRQRRERTGWDSLTGSELRVARLVAEGLTNREVAGRLFLSPHTVDTHIRHAFAKLGASSRVELARQVLVHDRAEADGRP